jgi:molybdenum cofactor cytidylyltransferase
MAELVALPTVVVLASGRGERFVASGGTGNKLLADLCGDTVLNRTLQAVRASGLPWHLEDSGWPGMGDSISAAVRATPDASGWLVLPADLPLIQAETLRHVATVPTTGDVLVPHYRGQRAHPVRFGQACLSDLLALRGNQGAAPVTIARGATKLEVDDPGCVLDVDTMADLESARMHWMQRVA